MTLRARGRQTLAYYAHFGSAAKIAWNALQIAHDFKILNFLTAQTGSERQPFINLSRTSNPYAELGKIPNKSTLVHKKYSSEKFITLSPRPL